MIFFPFHLFSTATRVLQSEVLKCRKFPRTAISMWLQTHSCSIDHLRSATGGNTILTFSKSTPYEAEQSLWDSYTNRFQVMGLFVKLS